MGRCSVKRLISTFMVLLIVFSSLQLPYMNGEADTQVYAAEDASIIFLSADPLSGATLSTVTAVVYDAEVNPFEGKNVHFSTDFGSLDTASATTDASGKASVTLSSDVSGTAVVQAFLQVGELISTEVQLYNPAGDAAADKAWLTDEIILEDNPSLDFIVASLYLPESGPNGSDISWTASNTISDMIITNPQRGILGAVEDRNYWLTENVSGTLTAQISKDNEPVEEKIFNLTIIYETSEDMHESYLDYTWLTTEQILNENPALDTLDNITSDLNLPTTGPGKGIIEWQSYNPDIVSNGGIVTRPTYAEGDQSVMLVAKIYKGTSRLKYKSWFVTVKAVSPDDPEVVVDETYDWLTVDRILNGNSSDSDVTENLNLFEIGPYGGTISWSTSDGGVIDQNGEVTRPAYNEGDKQVTLTATISKENVNRSKEFTLIVKQYTDDEVVALDKEWLAMNEILNGNVDSNNVTSNLILPLSGPWGSSISWMSTNETIVALNGTVNRPLYTEGDQTVSIEATISKDTATDYNSFDLTVLATELGDEEAVEEDYNWLTDERVLNGGTADNVSSNLIFPLSGPYGSSIRWTSTNETIVALDGTVTRPSFTEGDEQVTITAEVFKGSANIKTKRLELLISSLNPSDAEVVTLDKAWLEVNETLGENLSQYAVKTDLSLPVSAPNGADISWISDTPSAIANNGQVNRPEAGLEAISVNMTAIITNGTEQDSKEFEYTIISLPDITPPKIVDTTPGNNSTGVSFDSKITVTFDEEVKKGENWNAIYLGLHQTGWYEGQSYSLTINSNQLIMTPNNDMEFGKEYLLRIPAGAVTDQSGNALKENLRLKYSVEESVEREIEVIASNPANGEKEVSLKPELSFRYSDSNIEVGRAFDNILLRARNGAEVSVTPYLSDNTVTLEMISGEELEPEVVYELVIPEGAVQDSYKNESNPRMISFMTEGSNLLYEVNSTYPVDGQENVDINQSIEVNFSEMIKNWENSDVELIDENGNWYRYSPQGMRYTSEGAFPYYRYPHGFSYSLSDNCLMIQPETLEPETQYTLSVPFADYSMSFTTGGNALSIDQINPIDENANGNAEAAINTTVEIEFSSSILKVLESENIEIRDSMNNPIAFSSEVIENKVIVTPSLELTPSETYTVNIPSGAYENENNELNDTRRFKFTIASKLDYDEGSYSFEVEPLSDYLTYKALTFNSEWLESLFENDGREIISFEWSFGDGRIGSGKTVEHTYTTAGDYSISLRLKDNKGLYYEYEQTVTVKDIAGNAEISFPYYDTMNTYFVDDSEYESLEFFRLNLSYNGVELPQEEVNVLLYNQGVFIKELTTAVTDDSGSASVPFFYSNLYGTYELVFVHGSMEEGTVERIPVTVDQTGEKQSMRIKLENFEEEASYSSQGVWFKLDGHKKFGELQIDAFGDIYYVIPDVPVGKDYTLELPEDEIFGENYDIVGDWVGKDYTVSNNGITVSHLGAYQPISLPVVRKKPGINSIKSDYSDSRNYWIEQGLFFEGSTDEIEFEIDGDDAGKGLLYYELKFGSRVNHTDKSSFKVPLGLRLKSGERFLVRMVTRDGEKSDWVDANVKVVPRPSIFGSDVNIDLKNGTSFINTSIAIDEIVGGNISILDDIPLLDSASFGLDGSNNRFRGVISKEKIELYLGDNNAFDIYDNVKEYDNAEEDVGLKSVGYGVSATVAGKLVLVYNKSEDDWDFDYGYITIKGDGSYGYKRSYTIPIVNIGIETKLSLGSQLGGTLIFPEGSNSDAYQGIIYFAPYVNASLNAGADWVSVEGYLMGIVSSEFHIPTGYIEVEPAIRAGIVGHFLTYSTELYGKDLVNVHWDNGKSEIILAANALASPLMLTLNTDDTQLEPMPRNYLDRDSHWLDKSQPKETAQMRMMTLAQAVENPKSETLKDNIYPYADIQLVRNGDELWMVWTEDNPQRSAINRTQMMYAVYKDGYWSLPQWMGNDDTADFHPVATSTGNGVLMAWQNIKQEITEESVTESVYQDESGDTGLGAIIKNAEISVTDSVYQVGGSDVQFITLTDDDKFDHSPKLAAEGDNALLVWTKSEGVGFTLGADMEKYRSPENSDRLVFSKWNGSTWSAPMEIANSLPTVMNSSLAMHANEGLLLYTLDMDNDQSTQGDRQLFARIYNGNSWGEEVPITGSQVSAANPKAVYTKCKWFITWHQDGNIMYQEGVEGKATTEDFLQQVPGNYEIAVKEGEKPQIALIYRQMDEDNAQRFSASFYDIENGIWSNEIELTDEEGYIRSFSPVFTEDGKLNITYTQAEIITEVIDGTENPKISDKVDLNMMTYTPVHDLAFDEEGGLELSTEMPLPSTEETITVTLENQGDFSETATIYLYNGNPEEGGTKIGEVSTEDPIPARSFARLKLKWIVDENERDKYDIYAVVDPDNAISETDENNNVVIYEVKTADIAVTDLDCKNLTQDNYLVTARVKNAGSIALGAIQVQLEHSESEEVVGTREFDQLRPGQEAILNFFLSSEGLAESTNGKINMVLRASLADGLDEYATDNNIFEFELEPAQIVVQRMNPAPGETKVGIQEALSISFNMNVEQGESFDEISLEDEKLNEIQITKELENDTLTVIPESDLDYNTQYTITIPKKAIGDNYGHTMDNQYQLSFTTTISSPEVLLAYPGDGMEEITLDTDIKMLFNQDILEGATIEDIALYEPVSAEIAASVSIDGEWLHINPVGQLQANTVYALLVPAGAVKNEQDEVLQYDYLLEFETGHQKGNDDDDNDDVYTGDSNKRNSRSTSKDIEISKNNQVVLEALKKNKKAVLYLENDKDSKVQISPEAVSEFSEGNYSIRVESEDIVLEFSSKSLITPELNEAIGDQQAKLELGALAINEVKKQEILNNAQIGESTGLFDIGGKIFDLTAQIVDKYGNKTKIENFNEPVAVTIDLSDVNMAEEIANLTGIRYEIDEQGNIVPVKLGGAYDLETKTFTFYTDSFSLYGILKADKLTKISLTIGSLQTKVNENEITNDVAPTIINNRTMVPIRFISESMGAEVKWIGEERKATIELGERMLVLVPDQTITGFDTPATIVNDRILVPIRYIAEMLNSNVQWFPQTKEVYIVR